MIENAIKTEIAGTDLFIVEIKISKDNVINVHIDKPEGITINECTDLSRRVSAYFDREVEDYELNVSSPGLEMPLRVAQQYEKNIGRELELIFFDGQKKIGTLLGFAEDEIEIEFSSMQKVEGKKRKQLVSEVVKYKTDAYKSAKVYLNFK